MNFAIKSNDVLIGESVGSVALDVKSAFWEASLLTRSLFAFFSGLTISMLTVTTLGSVGVLDRK